MQVQSLEAFGVHRDLLRAWEDNYSKELLPVQAEVVAAGKVLSSTAFIRTSGLSRSGSYCGREVSWPGNCLLRRSIYTAHCAASM